MKTCMICNVEKKLDEFSPASRGIHRTCKLCRSEQMRQHRKENPDTYRGYEYKKKYKISLDTYNKILEEQGGVCAICGGVWSRSLVVDHDHDCCPGETTCGNCLRALLCGSCNAGLGWFKHDPKIMESAIRYIKEVKARPWG